MPQGGGSTSNVSAQSSEEGASRQIFRLIREGVSWSGHERNTCFLSSGATGRFIDISKASGFDFPDDGRAMVLTDWDGDGDLDSFTSNRNAPQIRFLRNDIPKEGAHWISMRLKGSEAVNRDAIGARVKLVFDNQPPISRTLRAGDGFQAQGSKQLHFGLGSSDSIKSIQVRWPNGEESEYESPAVDCVYTITHGKEDAIQHQRKLMEWPSSLPPLELKDTLSGARASLRSDLPAPQFSYTDFNGEKRLVRPGEDSRPLLINLWASWCAPCLAELKEFNEKKALVESSGLQVLALSVEGVDGQEGNQEKALAMRNKIAPYFETGTASVELLEKIRILHDLYFEKRGSLVVPTSILINAKGSVIGYYEGKITPEEMIEVLSSQQADQPKWACLPFSGRWLAEPLEFRFSEYGNKLLDSKFHDDAAKLFNSRDWRMQGVGLERFLSRLGTSFEQSGDPASSIPYFSKLADLRPKDPLAQEQLGAKLTALGRVASAAARYQKSLEIDPSQVNVRYNLGILLNRLGKPNDALTEFKKVISAEPNHTMALANCASHHIKRNESEIAISYLERVVATQPSFLQAQFQLAQLYETLENWDKAKNAYQKILELEPGNPTVEDRLKKLPTEGDK